MSMERSDWTALIAAICRLGGSDPCASPSRVGPPKAACEPPTHPDSCHRWEQWLNAFEQVKAFTRRPDPVSLSMDGSATCARLITQGLSALSFDHDVLVTSNAPFGISGSVEKGLFFALALSPRDAIFSTPKTLDFPRLSQASPHLRARFVNLLTVAGANCLYSRAGQPTDALQSSIGWGHQEGVAFFDVWRAGAGTGNNAGAGLR
jgi:hypothetical protein